MQIIIEMPDGTRTILSPSAGTPALSPSAPANPSSNAPGVNSSPSPAIADALSGGAAPEVASSGGGDLLRSRPYAADALAAGAAPAFADDLGSDVAGQVTAGAIDGGPAPM